MDIRKVALASAAIIALATPAAAAMPGWYLGAAVGYDHLEPVSVNAPGFGSFNAGFKDAPIYVGDVGYKFDDSGLRLELELGFEEHDVHSFGGTFTGGESTSSALLNAAYDFDIGDGWSFDVGSGAGIADVNAYVRDPCCGTPDHVATGATVAFQWQAIGGFSYALASDVDVFADYHFRSAEVNHNFADPWWSSSASEHVDELQEHAGLLGIRWYLNWAPPAASAP
jgi:opacity protein-like surface antigen